MKPPTQRLQALIGLQQRLRKYLPAIRSVATNSLWLMIDRLARALLNFVMSMWIARTLGPAIFGEYIYAVTLIALFLTIANLGMDGIAIRDLARRPEDAPRMLGTIASLRLSAGLICWPLALLAVSLLRPEDRTAWTLVAIIGVTLVLQSAETIDLWFQSQSQNRKPIQAKLMAYAAGNTVRIVLILLDAPLWALALSISIDAALVAALLTMAYVRTRIGPMWYVDVRHGLHLLRQAWPFMVGGLAVIVYMRIDQIMVREMLGEKALGLYSSALIISQVFHFLPMTICTAMAPYMARRKQENEEQYYASLMVLFRLLAITALGISALMLIFSQQIITTLYGPQYETAAPLLVILAFSNIFVFLGIAQSLWLVNEGLNHVVLYRTGLGAIASMGGNFVLIPSYGLIGAACSSIIAMFISAMASNIIWAPKILKMQVRAIFQLP